MSDPSLGNNRVRRRPQVFFCHECQNQFRMQVGEDEEPNCQRCGSNFCEIIQSSQPVQSQGIHVTRHNVHTSRQPNAGTGANNPGVHNHMVTIAMDPENFNPQALFQEIINTTNQVQSMNGAAPQGNFSATIALGGQTFNLGSDPRNFAWGPSGLQDTINRLMEEHEGARRPADEAAISAIESYPLTSHQISSMKETSTCECSICMGEYSQGTIVKKLPCLHTFHCDCIDSWLRLHNSCPVCRHEIDGSNPDRLNQGSAGAGNNTTDDSTVTDQAPPSYFS